MVPPKDKGLNLDILSNLDEDILDDIMIRLPFPDAVRTSILSKKWRCKWRRLSQLVLDKTLWKIHSTSYFNNIIRHILSLHEGPVKKFTLCVPYLEGCRYIEKLMGFLSKNGIEELCLTFPIRDKPYQLPSSIYKCLKLRHLALEDCLVPHPQAFRGFGNLISLKLCNVTISSVFLENLISGCLLLEQLVLEISHDLSNVIEISAPKLKSFDFTGNIRFIHLKTTLLLAKVSLTLRAEYTLESRHCIAMFLEPFCAVEHLHLDHYSVKFLTAGAGEVPTSLPFHLNAVKNLYLFDLYLNELYFVSCALCLMRSFPYLQYLEIKVDNSDVSLAQDDLDLEETFADVTFDHLNVIVLGNIRGKNPHLQLVKLLLAKSPVLQRITIEASIYEDYGSMKSLMEQSKFQCASPKVEVVIKIN